MKRSIQFLSDLSLAQQCFERLQLEIVGGVLKPGEKLKVEPIKDRFGIGQSPVREALSKLSALGLVETEENKGFRVAAISQADIRDCYAVMTAIESLALTWSIKHGDDEWKANIVAQLYKLSLVEQSTVPVSDDVWLERNADFHLALISGCKSPLLLELRSSIYSKFDRYCRMSYGLSNQNLHINHEHHKELADAVLARDTVRAKKLMHDHINGALEDVIQIFKDQNLF